MTQSHRLSPQAFKTVGLVGQPRHELTLETHGLLYHWLIKQGYSVLVEAKTADILKLQDARIVEINEIGQQADLAIVIGGDGNMLGAARILAQYPIKVIGVNRGHLGFLTDLNPDNMLPQLSQVLNGEYEHECRFLLEAALYRGEDKIAYGLALNEAVLHPNKVAHMIEFEVYIDGNFAFSQRSDGLIIATPTGSTAYSLSAGGPILHPTLDAIALVPMFPHTLSSRPLVINSHSEIRLKFPQASHHLEMSCDSQLNMKIEQNDEIRIRRSPYLLNLIHPKGHIYYTMLSSKLGWSTKL